MEFLQKNFILKSAQRVENNTERNVCLQSIAIRKQIYFLKDFFKIKFIFMLFAVSTKDSHFPQKMLDNDIAFENCQIRSCAVLSQLKVILYLQLYPKQRCGWGLFRGQN